VLAAALDAAGLIEAIGPLMKPLITTTGAIERSGHETIGKRSIDGSGSDRHRTQLMARA
jgi:hypothetical protein